MWSFEHQQNFDETKMWDSTCCRYVPYDLDSNVDPSLEGCFVAEEYLKRTLVPKIAGSDSR